VYFAQPRRPEQGWVRAMAVIIHPSAFVDPKAQLADGVTVGAFSIIGPNVSIGANTQLNAHVIIEGHTTVGADNCFHAHSVIGGAPQDKKYAGEPTQLIIGDRNTFRESVTVNCGTVQDGGVTRVGSDNWIMAYVHIAHDCKVGNNTIMANCVQLAGHVVVGDWAILGGFTGVHQFCKIGAHAMAGVGSVVLHDIPPYVMVSGNSAEAHGINTEGLKRRGFSQAQIVQLRSAYKTVYKQGLTFEQAKLALSAQVELLQLSEPDSAGSVAVLAHFLNDVTRGIVR
jgi:UDP-N-acetylglucosamine acyltransferase